MYKKFSRSICFMLVFTLLITNVFSIGMTSIAKASGASLILSQYVETSSGTTPKGIEIWNTSGLSIDFSSTNLRVLQGTNGGVPSEKVIVNSGTLPAGEVMVIGTSDIGTYLTDQGLTDILYIEESFTFNGDDALQIEVNGEIVDTFGEPGNDPGSSWSGNGVVTANSNIGIKEGITIGDTDGWIDPSERFETISTDNSLTGFGIAPEEKGLNILHTPITSSNIDENISIGFDLTYDGHATVTESVYTNVYYKPSDETNFNSINANKGDGTFGAVIPADEVTQDIEYYIESSYQGNTAREPQTDSHTITIEAKDYSDREQLLSHIGNFTASDGLGGRGVAEIVKYDKGSKKAFVVNGVDQNISIDVVDLSGLQKDSTSVLELTTSESIKISDLTELGSFTVADITCIDIHPSGNYFAVSIPEEDKTNKGKVAFFNIDESYTYKGNVDVGYLPDNLAFTPDGNTLLVANEGEPNDDYSVDPDGSVSIIEVSGGVDSITQDSVSEVGFETTSVDANVIVKNGATNNKDFEPEYIVVDANSQYAYIALQENNAVAKLDIGNQQFTHVYGLGFKDWSISSLDPSNKDDGINIKPWPLLGMYMPDGIDIVTIDGKDYIFTANEGDGREYDGYENEITIDDISDKLALNADYYAGYTQEELDVLVTTLADNENLGKIKLHSEMGINTEDKYEALYTFGGRSFSIYDTSDFSQVYDSDSEIEEITAQRYPDCFNSSDDEVKLDDRSDNKGPEPEDVKVGKVGDKYYAFIGLERMGGVMVYDVTDPENATFVQYMNTRDYSADIAGDCAPEGLKFVPREDSPIDQPLLLVANEVSGTLSVFQVKDDTAVADYISISEARQSTGTITVQGNVTCTDGGKVFIEDETAGINLYNQSDETSFREGDLIKVTGSIAEYKGLLEIEDYTVTIVESKYEVPVPQVITTFPTDWEAYESELVLIKNATIETLDISGTTTISDSVGNTIGIYNMPSQAGVNEGDSIDLLAVVSCYNTHQLHVRKSEDVTLSVSEEYMTLTEAREQAQGTEVTVRGIVTYVESDTLIYIQDGTDGMKIDAYGSGGLATFNVGDLVIISGEIGLYKNELQVVKNNISVLGTGFTLPEAKSIEISDLSYYQGQIVELPTAKITSISDYSIYAEDINGNEITIYHAKADNFDVSNYEVGTWYKTIGIAAMYNDEQVKLRDGADLIEQETPQDSNAILPIIFNTKPANMASTFNRDIQISAQVEKTIAEIDTGSIELYLDGNLLTHTENNSTVTANVYNLDDGDHDVKLEVADINGQKNTKEWYFTVEDASAEYNFYFGIPHCHTSYSDGKGTPEEAFQYGYNNELDWMFVTDHSNWFDGVKYEPNDSEFADPSSSYYDEDYMENYEYNENTDQYEEKEGSEWYETEKEVESFNASNDFLALRGFEMTFSDVGHINVLDSEAYVEAKSQMSSLSDFYDWVENLSEVQDEEALVAFNHPNWPSDSFNNQAYVPELDREISMIEVGNGAPPYSYSRSEEQFIRALDNGWHLGAINAQDNHSTNWGDPDNLTAVISESLSEEDIKEAMRNRRVYSTETRNLELTVKANGHWMGSVIEVSPGETLDFEIEATDNEEYISKLEIITNGGEILQEKEFSPSATVTWNPTVIVPNGAQWYVVKVIHENGKWGTASPIYTPETDSDVKLIMLEVDPETTIPGYETALEATISNMGVRGIQNIEVKFYHDSISESNLIATATIDNIAAGENKKAQASWMPSSAGETKIIAKITDIPNVTTVTEISKTISIVPANGKTIMIDDAHGNYDITGGVGELIRLLRQYGYMVVINENTITEETLSGVDVLIITEPETGQDLSASEDIVIGNWVQNGGSLFVNAKSNYSDDSTMLNSLLEAVGTEIRFNDDNVYEPEDSIYYSGGMVWSVYAYNLPETQSKLNENMEAIRIFSGCSLVDSQGGALVNNSERGLEILLAGNNTSYNYDVGGKTGNGYEYNKEGELNGEAIPIIAKEEVENGKIVTAGRHPFSDYEIVNDVSNTALTLKLIDYLAGYNRIKTIKEVREDYANGILKEGDIVTVKGTATVDEEVFFDVIYIQDETSGISLYGSYQDNQADVFEGTEVIATGKIEAFEGEIEIQYDDYATSVLYIGFDEKVTPKVVSTRDAMDIKYTGRLIKTSGTITEINETGSYFKINDDSGEAYIHVDGYVGADMSKYEVGDKAVVTGIASIGSAGARIRVRGDDDLQIATNENNFYIIHTNDIHGRVEEGTYDGMGLAKIAEKINQLKNDRLGRVLVLDAGDTIHGQTIVQLSDGEAMIDIMNEMGYDAMTAGNHDFNYGQERLAELDTIANFPILAANVYKDIESKDRLLSPYIIKEIGGKKIGIFGLATPETTYKTHPNNVTGLTFRDPVQEANEMVTVLKGQECDVIIALTHLGLDEASNVTSEDVANGVNGIDIIIDGHSHTELPSGKVVNGTLIAQAGEYDKNIGVVDFTIEESGNIISSASLFTKDDATDLIEDPDVKAIIDEIKAENDEVLSEIIGSTEVLLDGVRENVRTGETNLGNLITDAMLDATGADIALTNGGGIRDSINIGDITRGEIITVLPFGNYVVMKEVKGSDIRAALEHGLSSYPATMGAFPHIGGMTVKFDSSKVVGSRVVEIKINGQTLDENMTYTLATNDFIAAGGDSYTMFADDNTVGEYNGLDEILISYIQKQTNATITTNLAKVEGRIQMINNSTKIAVMSDLHYFHPDLLVSEGLAFDAYLETDRKLIAESHALMTAAIDKIKQSDAGIVLVPGDLTKDGEQLSHEAVATFLSELEAEGKQVYVINGNHDINNPQSFSYDGDIASLVPNVSPEEFKTIYNDFGYEEALYKDSNSLSYVVEPVDGLWIVAMDSCNYDNNDELNHSITAGGFDTETLNWIKARIKEGESKNKTVIGMMHHGIVEHFDYQEELFSEYVIDDWNTISKNFADLGMKAVFTGHYHSQDIVKNTSSLGNEIYDIETGSLVTYPCPYRIVTIDDDQLDIKTYHIESIDYDTNGQIFQDYAKEYLIEGLDTLVESQLVMIMSEGMNLTDEQKATILAQINAELVPDTGITIKTLVIDAFVAHYQGDETIDPSVATIIQGMLQSTDSNTQLLAATLQSMYNDSEPQDNNLIITLKDLIEKKKSGGSSSSGGSTKTDQQKADQIKNKISSVKNALNKENMNKEELKKALKEANKTIADTAKVLKDIEDKEKIKEIVQETNDLLRGIQSAMGGMDSEEATASAKATLKAVKEIVDATENEGVIQKLKQEAKKVAQKAVEKAGEIKVGIKVEKDNAIAVVDNETANKQISEVIKAVEELEKELKNAVGEDNLRPVFVLDASMEGELKKLEVQLSASIIIEMKKNGIETAKVKMNGVEIKLVNDAFGKVSEKDNIALSAEQIEPPKDVQMDDYIKEVEGAPVYEFKATVNNEEVKEFKKPVALKIKFSENVSEKDIDFMSVAWLDEKTNKWIPVGGVYNKEDQTLSVKRPHFSKYTVIKSKKEYTDVKGHWAETELNALQSKGVLDKTLEFSPDTYMTREQFTAWLVRAYGLSGKDEIIFEDVDSTNEYYKEIAAAYNAGLIKGKSQTVFAPKATITRQEIATMVGRVMSHYNDIDSIKNIATYTTKFDDEQLIAEWANEGVAITQREGIFKGYEDGTLRPESNMTKAEGAAVIYRLYHIE